MPMGQDTSRWVESEDKHASEGCLLLYRVHSWCLCSIVDIICFHILGISQGYSHTPAVETGHERILRAGWLLSVSHCRLATCFMSDYKWIELRQLVAEHRHCIGVVSLQVLDSCR